MDSITDKILQLFPDLANIEDLSEEDLERFMADPEFSSKLDEVVGMMRTEDVRDQIMEAPGGVGAAQIDPNWQAALMERLQFDGDVPEYRVGRLQSEKGQKAAVPVLTNSMNPLVVGRALEDASEEVTEEAMRLLRDTDTNTKRFLAALSGDEQKMLEAGIVDALTTVDDSLQVSKRSQLPEVMAVPDPEGYKAGQLPAMREVQEQSATSLVQIPKEEQQQAIWKVIGTTQGRKSASSPIANTILKKLSSVCQIESGQGDGDPLFTAQWVRRLDPSGTTSLHFNPMSTAASVLHVKLLKEIERIQPGDRELLLTVTPLNGISVRRVGWQAELRYKHDTPRLDS